MILVLEGVPGVGKSTLAAALLRALAAREGVYMTHVVRPVVVE